MSEKLATGCTKCTVCGKLFTVGDEVVKHAGEFAHEECVNQKDR